MRLIYPLNEWFVSQAVYKHIHPPPPPWSCHIAAFFQLGWLLHPIYSATGDYPPVMKEWLAKKSKDEGYNRSRMPRFTKEEIEMVKGEFQLTATSDVTKK